MLPWDESGGCLLTGQVVSGIEVARAGVQAPVWNVGTPRLDVFGRVLERSAEGRTPSSRNCEGERTGAGQGDGPPRSSDEGPVTGLEPRGRVVLVRLVVNQGSWEEPGERIEVAGQAV